MLGTFKVRLEDLTSIAQIVRALQTVFVFLNLLNPLAISIPN